MIKVLKFGGTSVGSAANMKKVAEIVRRDIFVFGGVFSLHFFSKSKKKRKAKFPRAFFFCVFSKTYLTRL